MLAVILQAYGPDIHLKGLMTEVLLNGNKWRFPSTAHPSRSWKPCFQNTLESYSIPDPRPTRGYVMSDLSQPQCSNSCPRVWSPCFNKNHLFAPKTSSRILSWPSAPDPVNPTIPPKNLIKSYHILLVREDRSPQADLRVRNMGPTS